MKIIILSGPNKSGKRATIKKVEKWCMQNSNQHSTINNGTIMWDVNGVKVACANSEILIPDDYNPERLRQAIAECEKKGVGILIGRGSDSTSQRTCEQCVYKPHERHIEKMEKHESKALGKKEIDERSTKIIVLVQEIIAQAKKGDAI